MRRFLLKAIRSVCPFLIIPGAIIWMPVTILLANDVCRLGLWSSMGVLMAVCITIATLSECIRKRIDRLDRIEAIDKEFRKVFGVHRLFTLK